MKHAGDIQVRPEDKDLRVFGHDHRKRESVHEKSCVIRTESWHANIYGTCIGNFSHGSKKNTIRGKTGGQFQRPCLLRSSGSPVLIPSTYITTDAYL